MAISSNESADRNARETSSARLIFGDLWEFDPAPESADPRIEASYDLFIGGSKVAPRTGDYFESVNPANEEVISRIPEAREADVDAAFQAADKACRTVWSRMPGRERGKYLFRIARLLQDRAREFAVAETIDGGKPIRESDIKLLTVFAELAALAIKSARKRHVACIIGAQERTDDIERRR